MDLGISISYNILQVQVNRILLLGFLIDYLNFKTIRMKEYSMQ